MAEINKNLGKKEVDNVKSIQEKFSLFGKYIVFLKKMLKEPDFAKFEDMKKATLA